MITDKDVEKIRKALKPDFDRLDNKIEQSEKNIKQYIHEGVNDVVDGVDDLFHKHMSRSHQEKHIKVTPN